MGAAPQAKVRTWDHSGGCAARAARASLGPMRPLILAALALPLASACASLRDAAAPEAPVVEAALPAPPTVATETLDPTPPPAPPAGAVTAEALDTTTEEDRAAALAPPADAGSARLGTTVASLGPPADPGIWMETPLVTALTMGRVEYPATGESVAIELRPSGGDPGSGSQISLAAMRLLGAPLTGLPELVVYSG